MFFISGSGIIDVRLRPISASKIFRSYTLKFRKLLNEADNRIVSLTKNYHVICKGETHIVAREKFYSSCVRLV
eukprot:snap_masked-scaffold_29-processed-gene-2.47-mRNA-1 protein AED:1.00 eAED:1.00 QI:0/0/0/0/1/1/3/0/72